MNKKIVIGLLCPMTLFAQNDIDNHDLAAKAQARQEWTKHHFEQQGMPVPDGGVNIMPEKNMSTYNLFKKQWAKERADITKYGYVHRFMPETQSLINFAEISKHQLASNQHNPEGLKPSINDIKMAYDFKGVPAHLMTKSLGVAPSVTYVKGQGWIGAMQFFEKEGLGTCSYRENNVKLSHGAINIAEEAVSYSVNSKATVSQVIGQKSSGFTYNVDWYDNHFFRELKCAKIDYSADTLNAVIDLAKQIDSNG